MKRFFLPLILLSLSFCTLRAGNTIWGSAICLSVNGNTEFYNTKTLSPEAAIGNADFTGVIGVFGRNCGTLKILGAELNVSKEAGAAICDGTLFYTIYRVGARPAAPVFSTINLGLQCNCNGTIFNGCGRKACTGTNDQKLQDINGAVDLTALDIGTYTLEIYYRVTGGNGNCSQIVTDNGNNNYIASFSISSPLSINLTLLNGMVMDNAIRVKWVVEKDDDIIKYEVQKSENGFSFTSINTTASNQSTGASTYIFKDHSPVLGTNYYRIKAGNADGSVTLSRVFRVYYGKVGNTVFIYPNPSGNELTVRLTAITKGFYRMSVFNDYGQTFATIEFNHDGIDKTIKLKLPSVLSKGVYRLLLIDKHQFYKQSFLVK